jgi:hypothetical protein
MAYKVLTDGNGSGFIRVVGMGDYMPLEEHQSMVAEIEHKSKLLADVMAERDELASQLVSVKEGRGTGQSPCAKFCESVALRKDFDQLRDSNDKLKTERDALAAQVGLIRETWGKAKLSEMCNDITSIRKAINATPVQCLAEIRAEAGRAGFVAGINYLDKVWCKDATSDVVVAADEYAAKVRQGGE